MSTEYMMGHAERELRRLELQGSILNPLTEDLFRRAGIAEGMHVLDIGCGIGEVSMIAARLVGPQGRVTALDLDEGTLDVARSRTAQRGLTWIDFQKCDLRQYQPARLFDAVVGRLILMHVPDPLAILQMAFRALRSGGTVAFQEPDFGLVPQSYPALPTRFRILTVVTEFCQKLPQGNVGSALCHHFLQAGFERPNGRGEFPIDSGPDSLYYEWFAESIRSMLPLLDKAGLMLAEEVDIDTLAARLRHEAVSANAAFPGPIYVGCYARKP